LYFFDKLSRASFIPCKIAALFKILLFAFLKSSILPSEHYLIFARQLLQCSAKNAEHHHAIAKLIIGGSCQVLLQKKREYLRSE
jgi:hypothetical protein